MTEWKRKREKRERRRKEEKWGKEQKKNSAVCVRNLRHLFLSPFKLSSSPFISSLSFSPFFSSFLSLSLSHFSLSLSFLSLSLSFLYKWKIANSFVTWLKLERKESNWFNWRVRKGKEDRGGGMRERENQRDRER